MLSHASLLPENKVIQAWYHDNNDTKPPTTPHRPFPDEPVSLAFLATMGVELTYMTLPPPNDVDLHMARLCEERQYKHHDQLTLSFETDEGGWLPRIYTEHMHPDEEIRYVLEGDAYMDVRDPDDRWIRFHLVPGVLLVVPAGLYHRFTLTTSNRLKVVRLFKNPGGWISIVRDAESDKAACHQAYLEAFRHKDATPKAARE
ncbi:acireductone dioxygenase [Powellomyces hirtus]|uniref:Acireductone dioxygenase n=1 Tax=Powellomyces hirtus TaxID=109895 RepID=A0A507EE38_9FUNG|nr:acireductone dioxygenase [Powellomyces hirtus]